MSNSSSSSSSQDRPTSTPLCVCVCVCVLLVWWRVKAVRSNTRPGRRSIGWWCSVHTAVEQISFLWLLWIRGGGGFAPMRRGFPACSHTSRVAQTATRRAPRHARGDAGGADRRPAFRDSRVNQSGVACKHARSSGRRSFVRPFVCSSVRSFGVDGASFHGGALSSSIERGRRRSSTSVPHQHFSRD